MGGSDVKFTLTLAQAAMKITLQPESGPGRQEAEGGEGRALPG